MTKWKTTDKFLTKFSSPSNFSLSVFFVHRFQVVHSQRAKRQFVAFAG